MLLRGNIANVLMDFFSNVIIIQVNKDLKEFVAIKTLQFYQPFLVGLDTIDRSFRFVLLEEKLCDVGTDTAHAVLCLFCSFFVFESC